MRFVFSAHGLYAHCCALPARHLHVNAVSRFLCFNSCIHLGSVPFFIADAFRPALSLPFSDGYQYYSDEDEYSSDEDEYELENLPWSEGGEGGIGSLGLGGLTLEDGAGNSDRDMIFGAPKYSQEELQKMVDNLYGEGCTGEQVGPRPGAWGKSRWRPKGDNS